MHVIYVPGAIFVAENGDNMDHDSGQLAGAALMNHTDEEQYLSLMKELQFGKSLITLLLF